MPSTPIGAKKLSVPFSNTSHFDDATFEQSNFDIQKSYSIIGRNLLIVTENKLSSEKFKMLRAMLKSTTVDSLYKEQYDETCKVTNVSCVSVLISSVI